MVNYLIVIPVLNENNFNFQLLTNAGTSHTHKAHQIKETISLMQIEETETEPEQWRDLIMGDLCQKVVREILSHVDIQHYKVKDSENYILKIINVVKEGLNGRFEHFMDVLEGEIAFDYCDNFFNEEEENPED